MHVRCWGKSGRNRFGMIWPGRKGLRPKCCRLLYAVFISSISTFFRACSRRPPLPSSREMPSPRFIGTPPDVQHAVCWPAAHPRGRFSRLKRNRGRREGEGVIERERKRVREKGGEREREREREENIITVLGQGSKVLV